MKDSTSKIITAIAAVLYLFSFLFLNLVKFYDSGLTGSDILKLMDERDAPVWPYLFIVIPILVGIIRGAVTVNGITTKIVVVVNSLLMLIPLLMAFDDMDSSSFGWGFRMCFFLAFAIIAAACTTVPQQQPQPNAPTFQAPSEGSNTMPMEETQTSEPQDTARVYSI